MLLKALLEERHPILDDEDAQENGQESNVFDGLVSHKAPQQQPEDDRHVRLQHRPVELKERVCSQAKQTVEGNKTNITRGYRGLTDPGRINKNRRRKKTRQKIEKEKNAIESSAECDRFNTLSLGDTIVPHQKILYF